MNQTMLIADDSEMNRTILQMLFHENYVILEAGSGQEAFDVVDSCRENIDVVLLDLMMPGMDGFEVLKKRQELDYFMKIPVVVITASNAMDDQIKAFHLGANDFINKPFIPEIVVSRVNNVMASYQRMLSVELEAHKLKIKSELDEMTGLYNKMTTEMMMEETLREGDGKLHALLVIDIDNFKAVNDLSGHLAGDHTIRIVADLISSQFRKTDIVGRVGGDEFTVLMVNVSSMRAVRDKVNQLIQIMKYKPNLTLPENVTLSIGVASNGQRACAYQELFQKADESLYLAKQTGKARYREYGMEAVNFADDQRPSVLLISRNRGVCSTVHTLVPAELRVIEALDVADLRCLRPEIRDKVVLTYADVSGENGEAADFWRDLRSLSWPDISRTVAICRESDLKQYMAAASAGVVDVFTTPLDTAGFKRRSEKILKQYEEDTENDKPLA